MNSQELCARSGSSLGADRAAFAIFNQDEVVYAEAFGAEADGGLINPRTVSNRICEQMFTAIALLQELEANGLNIEDPYTTINPDFSIDATSELSAGSLLKTCFNTPLGM